MEPKKPLKSILKKPMRTVVGKGSSSFPELTKSVGVNDLTKGTTSTVVAKDKTDLTETVPIVSAGTIETSVESDNLCSKMGNSYDGNESSSQEGVSSVRQKGEVEKGSLMSGIAAKVTNVDGRSTLELAGHGDSQVPLQQPLHATVMTGNIQDEGKTSSGVGSQSAPKLSYASMFKTKNTFKSVNICELRNDERVEGAHVTIPLKEIKDVSARFANTLYGYFIGKQLAFPIMENYVKNTWAKYGLERVMLNNGFFLFQFSTKDGMDQVLEAGPWLIRSIPIFLNIWTPNTTLVKEEVTSAPVWLKLYNVPIVAYTEVGLSLVTTQIGKPIMLDSYTSSMCEKSWGRNSYARALVEVSSLNELMDHVVVAIPYPNGSGHSLVRIDIEYEWKPPRCDCCKIFDHNDAACPKNVKQASVKSNVVRVRCQLMIRLLMALELQNQDSLLTIVGSLKRGLMESLLQRVMVLIMILLVLRRWGTMVLHLQRIMSRIRSFGFPI